MQYHEFHHTHIEEAHLRVGSPDFWQEPDQRASFSKWARKFQRSSNWKPRHWYQVTMNPTRTPPIIRWASGGDFLPVQWNNRAWDFSCATWRLNLRILHTTNAYPTHARLSFPLATTNESAASHTTRRPGKWLCTRGALPSWLRRVCASLTGSKTVRSRQALKSRTSRSPKAQKARSVCYRLHKLLLNSK